MKQFESLLGVIFFFFFQDLSHPLLAKAIQGLSICFNSFLFFLKKFSRNIRVLFTVINK